MFARECSRARSYTWSSKRGVDKQQSVSVLVGERVRATSGVRARIASCECESRHDLRETRVRVRGVRVRGVRVRGVR
eukprot:6191454-Pleurochrysis_carterae.AAC.1